MRASNFELQLGLKPGETQSSFLSFNLSSILSFSTLNQLSPSLPEMVTFVDA